EAVRELRRRVKQDGFKGLRIVPWLWGLPPDDRRYYPLFAECCELDVPFCTQVGHAGPLRESERDARSLTSIASPWSLPNCASSAVTSVCRGSMRCCRS